jgi:DUF4097 and DUF4098 domain-containing protein YvlB
VLKKSFVFSIIGLVFLLSSCSIFPWMQQGLSGQSVFPEGNLKSIKIQMDSGLLVLEGSQEKEVQVSWVMHSEYDTIETNQQNGVLMVATSSRDDPNFGTGSETVKLTILVPPGLPVEVKGGNAWVQVKGYNGNIKVHTSSGQISAANLIGKAELISSGGSIGLNGGEGTFILFSPSDPLKVQNLHGSLTEGTVSGELHYSGKPNGNDSVHLQSVSGPVQVELGSGSDLTMEAYSVSGIVECPSAELRKESGCSGIIGGGSADFGARTVGGSITISLVEK